LPDQCQTASYAPDYEYSTGTYNRRHKVLVNMQASNVDALKSNSCVRLRLRYWLY